MFVGIVYLYELQGDIPVAFFTMEEDDMEKDDWLVEALVSALPNQDNFAWNGAHVLLTKQSNVDLREYGPGKSADALLAEQSNVDLREYGPGKIAPHPDDQVFTNEEIYDLFLNSDYAHLETYGPA